MIRSFVKVCLLTCTITLTPIAAIMNALASIATTVIATIAAMATIAIQAVRPSRFIFTTQSLTLQNITILTLRRPLTPPRYSYCATSVH